MAKLIDNALIEQVSIILGEQTSGRKITDMFQRLGYQDFDVTNQRPYTSTKWKRLNETITFECQKTKSAQPFFKVIQYIMNPMYFVDNSDQWKTAKKAINSKLLFYGFSLDDTGHVVKDDAVSTIKEAQKRLNTFIEKLKEYNIHQAVFAYCRPELFAENYFHAIFEASKGLMDRIRKMSDLALDGVPLINKAFNMAQPLLLIEGNLLKTQTEKSLYNGAKSLMLAIAQLYRNPKAHEPKLYDDTSETDAITAFVMISLAHRTLDRCNNVRDLDR